MRGDLPSISSAVLCSPLGLAALHSHHQQHQGLNPPPHTHNSVWVWPSIQTNTHMNSFSFSALSLTDSQQSGFAGPFSLSPTQAHCWISRQPFPLSNMSCGIQMQSDATNRQKVDKDFKRLWFCRVIQDKDGLHSPHLPWGQWIRLYEQVVSAPIITYWWKAAAMQCNTKKKIHNTNYTKFMMNLKLS